MGTVCGTLAVLGFMTALKSASRSVSESPRTCTIWCPAGGACDAAWDPGGAGCPGPDGGPCPWGGCAGGCPWPWGAGWGGGCCPGSMVSASPDAHPDQAGEGSARAPRLNGPRREKRRGRRAGLRWAAGAALSSLSGPGGCAAAPHPPPRRLRPRPAPRLHWSGGCASGGAARNPDLRRLRTFSFTPLTDAGQLVAFSLPFSLLFPFLVPSFFPFFSPAAAAPD